MYLVTGHMAIYEKENLFSYVAYNYRKIQMVFKSLFNIAFITNKLYTYLYIIYTYTK